MSQPHSDLLAVRAYITARDHVNYDTLSSDIIVCDVTHSNLQQRHVEVRLHKSDTLDVLRTKIHQQTGTPPHHQHLYIYTTTSPDANSLHCEIPPNTSESYAIGYFLHHHGWTVHVVDTNPQSLSAAGGLEDVRLVQKFSLTEEQYSQKASTLRRWKQDQLALDPTFTLQAHAQRHEQLVHASKCHRLGHALPEGYVYNDTTQCVERVATPTTEPPVYGPDSVAHVSIGQRCQLVVGRRRGSVAWIGTMQASSTASKSNKAVAASTTPLGYWVGVVLDEPVGRNNGTVQGVVYFEAPERHGALVRGTQLDVGDYPVRDLDDSDDEL